MFEFSSNGEILLEAKRPTGDPYVATPTTKSPLYKPKQYREVDQFWGHNFSR